MKNEQNELLSKQMINGKEENVFNLDIFEEVLDKGTNALAEALKIIKTVKTPEAKEWLRKYKTFAK